jgi:hypothetical protein
MVSHLHVQSSHPVALLFLYLRTRAIAVYVLCGWSTDNCVLSVRCATRSQTYPSERLLRIDRGGRRATRERDVDLSGTCHKVVLLLIYLILQNVIGRTLVGLWFWDQVDEDGESYWVFESRDVQ